MLTHSPRAFPWETSLPWAPVRVRKSTALTPEDAARARADARAKGTVASTSRSAGTSATAKIRNACGSSTAGWRRSGRPNVARPPRSKPSMPRRKERAASGPSPRPRPFQHQKLRRRVVTRQNFFFPSLMRSARLLRTTCDFPPQPGTLLLPRLSSGGSQCPGS